MPQHNKQSFWVGAILILLIIATRTQHFGNDVYLPDATLAVLFMGGLLITNTGWLGLALIAAFGMDGYAMGWQGVSDYCMSPGYWGLIPTYGLVWGAGRLLADSDKPFSILPFALFAWGSTSIAFVVSNAFWFAFSDKVDSLTITEFSVRVAKYYMPYVGYALMYVAIGWLAARLFKLRIAAPSRISL
ncbi:hypothetical protein FNL37_2321 [Methylovorus glucosotrophus]|jgi:hypothetical protein|uniref:hypothetical protein n=1 Tax=Methylovorus glucosotrophus TaxID=266009 RepID=UPI00133163C5|nr:hypothetical protein [Methylovorus glucosotrophus]KAF0836021.1 hypothetical protein FNL37_2321 [Methylovorus glucosotrophus]